MLKFKKQYANIINLFLFLCILPVAFICFGSFYIVQLDELLHDDLRKSIINLGTNASNLARLRMDNSIIRLRSIAANPILTNSDISNADKLDFVHKAAKRHGWLDVLISDENGVTLSPSAKTLNVSRRGYFKDAMNGNPAYSAILNSPLFDVPVVAHAVPLIKDHMITGILIAVEDASKVRFALGSRVAEQTNATNQFMDDNGVLLKGSEIMRENFYARVAGENKLDYKEVFDLINQHGDIERTFLYENQESYLIINPVGFSGWNVITIVPRHRAAQLMNDVLYFSIGTMCLMMILFIAYIIYLLRVRKTYKHHSNIARTILHVNGIFYVTIDSNSKILYANEFLSNCLKLELTTPLLLTNFLDSVKLDTFIKLIKANKPFVLPIITPNKQKIFIQWNVLPSEDKDTWILLGIDVSAHHHKIEMDLAKSHNDDLQQIIDSLPSPLLVHALDGEVLVANASAKNFLNVNNVEDISQALRTHLGEKSFNERLNIIKRVQEYGKPITSTVLFTDQNNKKLFFQNIQNPIFDTDGVIKACVSLSTDITENVDLQNQLEMDLSRLQAVLDNCPAGVFFSKNGTVHYCNPKAREMAGVYTGGPSPSGDTMVEGDVAGLYQSIMEGTNVYDMPFTICDTNGKLRDLLITAICTIWQEERVNVVWALEVTEMREIQKELLQAKNLAESATKAKGDFLATMSHEIRTPMNAILGFLYLFERNNLSYKQTNYLEKITISAAGLLRIINDILDFSKIEANKMELELEPFNLATNMNAIHSIMYFTAKDKGLELISHMDHDVPEVIVGDRERLNQILLNILGNAIKFTHKGSISLNVSVQEVIDKDNVILNFTITDTGIGLSEEQAKRLFQPFTQADTSTSRRFGGTGLGLVISSRLAELMGGTISLQSTEGKGSCFSVALQVQRVEDSHLIELNSTGLDELFAGESYAQVDFACLKGKKVLVVEDNMINQEIATAMLAEYELDLDLAGNGQEAIEQVKNNKYDLIFMDLQMPVMDGLEATQQIRSLENELPYVKTLPIIAMTANVMSEDRIRCTNAGMNAHLAKPISPQELQVVLMEWLCK